MWDAQPLFIWTAHIASRFWESPGINWSKKNNIPSTKQETRKYAPFSRREKERIPFGKICKDFQILKGIKNHLWAKPKNFIFRHPLSQHLEENIIIPRKTIMFNKYIKSWKNEGKSWQTSLITQAISIPPKKTLVYIGQFSLLPVSLEHRSKWSMPRATPCLLSLPDLSSQPCLEWRPPSPQIWSLNPQTSIFLSNPPIRKDVWNVAPQYYDRIVSKFLESQA